MLLPEQIKRHATLMDRMAETRGLDMEEQVLRGHIASVDVADAVLSCTNCTNPEGCAHWLDRQQGQANESPAYCRNTALFEGLLKL